MAPFRIPILPPKETKSIRFPVDIVEKVERAIVGKDTTFSAFVRVALESLCEQKEGE